MSMHDGSNETRFGDRRGLLGSDDRGRNTRGLDIAAFAIVALLILAPLAAGALS
jgi:hypothetical protein